MWHVLYTDVDLINELQAGQVVASLLTNELNIIRDQKAFPKCVEVYDEDGNLIATSSDICVIENMIFNK